MSVIHELRISIPKVGRGEVPSKRYKALILSLCLKERVHRFAEVGVDNGHLTEYLLKYPNCIEEYFAVDPWLPYGKDLDRRAWEEKAVHVREMKEKYPALRIIRKPSLSAVKEIPDEYLDLVFIDASREYAEFKADLIAWIKKVRRGGVIAGRDYSAKNGDIVKAHREVFRVKKADTLFGVWAERVK